MVVEESYLKDKVNSFPFKESVGYMKSRFKLRWYLLFVLPLILIFSTVVIIPFIMGIGYSFFSWDGLPLNPKIFVGFNNYIKLFSDTQFKDTAIRTVIFMLCAVVIINMIGFAFALFVTSKIKFKNAARIMLFMPYLIGGLILGYIWKFILGDGMAAIGEMIGNSTIFFNWLVHPKYSFIALIIVICWQMSGYVMVVYVAGLTNISDEVLEAAAIDGAGYWQTLFRIKLPLLMSSFTICLFLTLSNCFKIYDINVSLTGGGPNNSTEMFALNIYNEIFNKNNFGYGQAKAILFLLVVAIFTLIQINITKKKEVES